MFNTTTTAAKAANTGASDVAQQKTPGMTQEFFRNLLCALGIEAKEYIHEPLHFELDGVGFSVYYRFSQTGDSVIVCCDFGEPLAHCREQSLMLLMEMNMAIFGTGHACFCADTQTGRIQLLTMNPMPDDSNESLVLLVRQLAKQAQQWRVDNFLNGGWK